MFGASFGNFPLEQHVEHVVSASKSIPHSQGTIGCTPNVLCFVGILEDYNP